MINQSGLTKPFTSGVTDFDSYFTTGDQPFAQGGVGEWWSSVDFALPVEGNIDFDLGAVLTISRLAIWNRSLRNVRIHVSETLGGPMQLVETATLPNHTAFFSYLPTLLSFDAPQAARYVRIEVDSAYEFSGLEGFAYAIVGEVAVDVVPDAMGLPGDFDFDSDVDGADLAEWRAAFGVTEVGDADDDVDSDGEDFLIWQRQLGMSNALAAAVAIPEPATALMLILGMSAVAICRCGCRRRVRLKAPDAEFRSAPDSKASRSSESR
jgi:hypothetical protein